MLGMIPMLNTMRILIKKILNLKLVTMLEFQNDELMNFKNISAKGYAPNWSEEVFIVSRIKNML